MLAPCPQRAGSPEAQWVPPRSPRLEERPHPRGINRRSENAPGCHAAPAQKLLMTLQEDGGRTLSSPLVLASCLPGR